MRNVKSDLYMCQNEGCQEECSHEEVNLYKGINGEPICEECFGEKSNELWERRESWKAPKTLEIVKLRAENDELKKANEWQMIESSVEMPDNFIAVKEGSYFGASFPGGGFEETDEFCKPKPTYVMRNCPNSYLDDEGFEYGILTLVQVDNDGDAPLRLTHYKPLPSAPK